MNTQKTKQFMEQHGIVPIRADKSLAPEPVADLLRKLGNQSEAIPFYAIFPADRPNRPILMDGTLTEGKVIDALKRAVPAQTAERTPGGPRVGYVPR